MLLRYSFVRDIVQDADCMVMLREHMDRIVIQHVRCCCLSCHMPEGNKVFPSHSTCYAFAMTRAYSN